MFTSIVLVVYFLLFAFAVYHFATPHLVASGDDKGRRRGSGRASERSRPHGSRGRVYCNPITSTTVEEGEASHTCRCNWPTLFGKATARSDCDVPHACDGGEGVLVHKTTGRPLLEAVPPVDIHDYVCSACGRCNVPGPDPHTGLPSCVPRAFNDRERDMCLYNASESAMVGGDEAVSDVGHVATDDYRTTGTMLSLRSRYVDPAFAPMFTDRVRESAWVPNPCAFDLFDGSRLGDSCELRMTRKSRIAYCAPARDNVMTAVKDDTYLAGNRGRYPNACYRFAAAEDRVNGYVVEYFARPRTGVEMPAPVVSMRIDDVDVLDPVLDGLGLERQKRALLFTQPEPPADVGEFPHPFTERLVDVFKKEVFDWVDELPAHRLMVTPFVVWVRCTAPAQPLAVPTCSDVGADDRFPAVTNRDIRGIAFIGDHAESYAKTTLSCSRPDYDRRFPIVPNYNRAPGAVNSDPVSAVLLFDKSDNTVRPYWKDSVAKPSDGERKLIERYVREMLRSAPNEQ